MALKIDKRRPTDWQAFRKALRSSRQATMDSCAEDNRALMAAVAAAEKKSTEAAASARIQEMLAGLDLPGDEAPTIFGKKRHGVVRQGWGCDMFDRVQKSASPMKKYFRLP